MGAVIDIFKQLGVDQTIVAQFIVVIILFFVLKATLFQKLLEVLMERENQTVKMDEGADSTINEAESLNQEYQKKINEINAETQKYLTDRKSEISNNLKSKYVEKQKEFEEKTKKEVEALTQELKGKESAILGEADNLSNQLVEKFIQ